MCGIIGALSTTRLGFLNDHARTHAAIDSLAHRGPDGRGIWSATDARAFLGHRRLSIIDIAGGAQPIPNERDTIRMCHNGEIYNYRALRADLESRGHEFRTRSDGETVVHLYEDRPDDFERELRGMFALAVVDETARRLTLARDRLGIKPLYFSLSRNTLIFASELPAILALLDNPPAIDRTALREYLRWKYVPTPRTIYAGIYELPPGTRLTATSAADGSLRLDGHRYWRPPASQPTPREEADLLDELDRRVRDAVESHLESDVEVGALLSGGVDSSLVVALATQLGRRRIKTFAVGFREAGFDQLPFARTLATHVGAEHFEEYVDLDPAAAIPRVAAIYGQPYGDSSALACLAVCGSAAKHVKVALTGDGGDEIFCGYQRHAELVTTEPPTAIAKLARAASYHLLAALLSPEAKFLRRSRAARFPFAAAYDDRETTAGRWLLDRLTPPTSAADPDADADLPAQIRALTPSRWQVAQSPGGNPVEIVQHRDLVHYLPGDILRKIDGASMAHALECRPPLLDHALVEFALGIPPSQRIPGGHPKHLLKKLAERYVPRELIHRKKRGFRVPIRRWLKAGLLEQARRDLLSGRCVEAGLLNRGAVEWILARQSLPWMNLSSLLWSLLILEHWSRRNA